VKTENGVLALFEEIAGAKPKEPVAVLFQIRHQLLSLSFCRIFRFEVIRRACQRPQPGADGPTVAKDPAAEPTHGG
jgi:hypothetical protein